MLMLRCKLHIPVQIYMVTAHSKTPYGSVSTAVTCNLIYDTLATFDLQISINTSIARRIKFSVKEKFG